MSNGTCIMPTISFLNGVYDFDSGVFTGEMHPPSPNVGYNYEPNLSHPELVEMLEQIIPDSTQREDVLGMFAQCLAGERTHQLHCFLGSGSNGKTILMNLFAKTMGGYFKNLPVSQIDDNLEKIRVISIAEMNSER